MGGYGANLKARFVGYSVKNIEGMRHTLELRQLDIPMIGTSNDFKQFIHNTPMMTSAVAIVAHDAIIRSKYKYQNFDDCFYAIVYEKRDHSDALYIYDAGMTILDIEDFRRFFRSKFFLFTPDKSRQSLDISGLFAIQDAKYLMSVLKKDIMEPMFLRGEEHEFELNEAFLYNEESLMIDHVTATQLALSRINPELIEPELNDRSLPSL